MFRGMGIQSVRKGVIAEDLEKIRELNTGAQIEGGQCDGAHGRTEKNKAISG